MLDMTFVAAVLDGIEGTLDELIGRVERSDLRGCLTTLQVQTAAARHQFEMLGHHQRQERRIAGLPGHTLNISLRRSPSTRAPARLR